MALAKVRLWDVIDSRHITFKNKIRSKHIDFLLVNKEYETVLAIEPDDKSHLSEKAKYRDEVKNRALASAIVPLLRITRAGYQNIFDLQIQIASEINRTL